jgi:hypothetical protein
MIRCEGLQLRNVKDQVNNTLRRQLELVSHCPQLLHNLIWFKELKNQLRKWPIDHNVLSVWLQFQQYILPHQKLPFRTIVICIYFHSVLNSSQLIFQ